MAGFAHEALVEIDPHACETLRHNRPRWTVIESDVRVVDGRQFEGIDLLAGGVPCPPFSIAGKQLGRDDERDLFPEMIRLAQEAGPRGVMIENVRGLLSSKFEPYRAEVARQFEELGYQTSWQLLNASAFGVPQLRPRTIFVALRPEDFVHFAWPEGNPDDAPTVGQVLLESMAEGGWEGAIEWALQADAIAPTLVGGSKKHGGADLGPTRARRAWAELGVNGLGVADAVPEPGFQGAPKLTVRQAALIQGFPPEWEIQGRKTAAYRQVGNAFPPPVARAVAANIRKAWRAAARAARSAPATSREQLTKA